MIINFTKSAKIVLAAIMLLSVACKDKSKENDTSGDFYSSLHSQIEEGDFLSPLAFARAGKKEQLKDISFTEGEEAIEFTAGSDTYKLIYSPISIFKTGEGKQNTASYNIKMHLKDGTAKTINRLQKPEKVDNKIVFRTDADGTELALEAIEGSIKWSINSDKNVTDSLSLIITTAGPYFGGGERFLSSVLDGRGITNQPMDHYRLVEAKDETIDEEFIRQFEPSYLQIPFILTPGGLGWYFDNAATMHMKFDREGNFFEVRIPGSRTDFYVFEEDTPKDILTAYTGLIGRQPALPDWAFGVWVTALQGKDSVYSKVHRLKKWDIPATAIWMYDFDDPRISSGFSVPSTLRYGDIRQLTDSLHNMGLKALAYVHPFSFKFNLHDRSENPVYTYLDSLGLILKTTRTLDPSVYKFLLDDGQYDFYNHAMYEGWKSFMHQLLITDNFDGWMEDFGDIGYIYNTIEKKWEGIPFNIEYDMSDHEYFNMFPLVFHKLTYEVSTEHKKDVVTFSRSGSAGSAAYCPLIWGGDQTGSWDKKLGYPSSVTAAITSGLSGYGNWTPDILSDSPSKELWMRWVQFGAFTLVMRDHLWHYDPKTINLWTDESTQKFFKKYADIHTQLIPYLKTAAAQYQQTGCPVIRHMFLEFPEDKEALKCEYQYMLGDKLLVAPVVEEGAKSNNVYFPKGLWLDYWTKKEFSSAGEWITVPAPLDIIPVFERIN